MINLKKKYLQYQKDNLLRKLIILDRNKDIIDFTSSDYLNLSNSSNLKEALSDGFDKYGFGSQGSSIVCGYTDVTKELEIKFASFVNYPKAIFFNSGYMANLAIYSTLFDKNSTLFADKYIHASTIDGVRLAQTKLRRYNHQDLTHLKNIYNNKSFITSEGIFSTSGSISKLDQISQFAPNKLIVDEAHSFGILGENGKGSINKFQLTYRNCPITIFPLGKAFGGIGAMVCTTTQIGEYLIQFARNYIYTTALPPMLLKAAILQLENLKNADNNRKKLYENIYFFNSLCKEKNLKLFSNDISPIRSIIVKNSNLAMTIKNELRKYNILVSCFRYPTVPINQPVLRFSIHSKNTFAQIEKTLNIIGESYEYI